MQFADVAYALKTQTAIKMPLKSGKVLPALIGGHAPVPAC